MKLNPPKRFPFYTLPCQLFLFFPISLSLVHSWWGEAKCHHTALSTDQPRSAPRSQLAKNSNPLFLLRGGRKSFARLYASADRRHLLLFLLFRVLASGIRVPWRGLMRKATQGSMTSRNTQPVDQVGVCHFIFGGRGGP